MKKINGKLKYNNKGITLISLMVTIIILLILTGISIATLTGDNGIIKQAINAKKMTEIALEKEAIEVSMLSYQMSNIKDSTNDYYIGTPLKDKIIDGRNSSWNIVTINNTQEIYGTGWNYISKGIEIKDYGKTRYEWIVNYNTGELVYLETESYTTISSGDSLAIADGLIFNVDSSMIEGSGREELEQQLGSNIELMDFDWNEDSGLTSTSFNLDGIDDYIKIKYNSPAEKQEMAENGFTFEFYGILNEGNSYDVDKQVIDNYNYKGVFCYWNGNENDNAEMRFGIANYGNTIRWNTTVSKDLSYSDYSQTESVPWNQDYILEDTLYNKEVYYTITLKPEDSYEKDGETYYKQTLYLNGEKTKYDGGFNKKQWDTFIEEMENLKYFCIGRSSMGHAGYWHYTKMNCYSLRLYNRGLSESEVKENYNKSVAYHNTMIND